MDLLDPYKKYLEENSIVPYLSIKDLIIYIKKFITDGRALIISAYPAMGKTYFTETINEKYKMKILDSDSSFFKWNYDYNGNKLDTVNRTWPDNYIDYIKSHLLTHDIIFVSSHEEVRKALCLCDIDYYTFVPDYEYREEIFKRMKKRCNTEEFIKTRRDNFANKNNFCPHVLTEGDVEKINGLKFMKIKYIYLSNIKKIKYKIIKNQRKLL